MASHPSGKRSDRPDRLHIAQFGLFPFRYVVALYMALRTKDISYRHSSRFALQGISLDIPSGSFTGLIGPNGSGKTTLIKILCGMLAPDRGSVEVNGTPLSGYSASERAHHIAYVSQTWRPAFEFTVEQTVLIGRIPWQRSYGGFESEEDVRAANEAIALMELERFRYEPVTRLSGGELQRVMIATALAQRTNILILDEPTTHLDVSHQQQVLEILHQVMQERELTVLASIHDLNLASMYSDFLIMMQTGQIVAQGTPDTVFTEDMLKKVFGLELSIHPHQYGNAPAIQYRSRRVHVHGE